MCCFSFARKESYGKVRMWSRYFKTWARLNSICGVVYTVSIFSSPVGCLMTESISTNKTAPRLASWYCYGGVLNRQGQSLSPHGACSADPSDNQEVKLSVSWMHFQVGQVSRSQIFHMLKYFNANVSVVFRGSQEDIGQTISKKNVIHIEGNKCLKTRHVFNSLFILFKISILINVIGHVQCSL